MSSQGGTPGPAQSRRPRSKELVHYDNVWAVLEGLQGFDFAEGRLVIVVFLQGDGELSSLSPHCFIISGDAYGGSQWSSSARGMILCPVVGVLMFFMLSQNSASSPFGSLINALSYDDRNSGCNDTEDVFLSPRLEKIPRPS
ncbi:PREDICTED: uncharacterized protein LOC109166700 [Ipomoea nil]|uniref:uncharacterized protein LOC109166700 n=1 Tax=Ipomoea nil TaxID=35883 RepID=UPI00090156FA|nr:PREDICTED: uncharacterized protein LOC109166700 [Ipomoea nil]